MVHIVKNKERKYKHTWVACMHTKWNIILSSWVKGVLLVFYTILDIWVM